jgi:hypothetical protein
MTNNTIVVKDFSHLDLQGLPTSLKKELVATEINTSRYAVLGAVNQFGKFRLKCRYHNMRDNAGRWTCKRSKKNR